MRWLVKKTKVGPLDKPDPSNIIRCPNHLEVKVDSYGRKELVVHKKSNANTEPCDGKLTARAGWHFGSIKYFCSRCLKQIYRPRGMPRTQEELELFLNEFMNGEINK